MDVAMQTVFSDLQSFSEVVTSEPVEREGGCPGQSQPTVRGQGDAKGSERNTFIGEDTNLPGQCLQGQQCLEVALARSASFEAKCDEFVLPDYGGDGVSDVMVGTHTKEFEVQPMAEQSLDAEAGAVGQVVAEEQGQAVFGKDLVATAGFKSAREKAADAKAMVEVAVVEKALDVKDWDAKAGASSFASAKVEGSMT